MKVILLEELRGKGGEGDVIDVAPGFANNYLLRRGIAVKATKGNLKQLEQRRKNIAKREEVRLANAHELESRLDGALVELRVRVGEEGQLFGSITAQMIADAVASQLDVELDRRRIELPTPIKTIGEHSVAYAIYRDIKGTIKLSVVDGAVAAEKAAEAEAAAEAAAEAEVEVEAAAEAAAEAEVAQDSAEETVEDDKAAE